MRCLLINGLLPGRGVPLARLRGFGMPGVACSALFADWAAEVGVAAERAEGVAAAVELDEVTAVAAFLADAVSLFLRAGLAAAF